MWEIGRLLERQITHPGCLRVEDPQCFVWLLILRPPNPLQMLQPVLPLQGLPRFLCIWYCDETIILLVTLIDDHCWKRVACFVHNNFSTTQLCTNVWMVHQQTHHITDMDRQPSGIIGSGIMQTSMVRSVTGIADTPGRQQYNIPKRSMIYSDITLSQ